MITKNFDLWELECPCCSACNLDTELPDKLQKLREELGWALHINSAYRCNEHNKEVGGVDNSQHKLGRAVDISTEGWSGYARYQLVNESMKLGFRGIGIYENFIHIDLRTGSEVLWS